VLKVVGDSMIEAAICEGDWTAVRRQPVAENGDVAAATLDGEATVKRFKREDGHVWLLPHNSAYEPTGDDATWWRYYGASKSRGRPVVRAG
jgi:repressor LexA